jgi:hypothetical protein
MLISRGTSDICRHVTYNAEQLSKTPLPYRIYTAGRSPVIHPWLDQGYIIGSSIHLLPPSYIYKRTFPFSASFETASWPAKYVKEIDFHIDWYSNRPEK